MRWSGLFTALITPFKENHLDLEGLVVNIREQVTYGIDGLCLLGTTGESPTLSLSEKQDILQIAKDNAPHLPLLVGTGTNSTATTIELTSWAASQGAHAALVIAPYYNKPTQEGLFHHFKETAMHSPIPVILYNHPGRTGVQIEIETVLHLLEIDNIAGIKESSADLSRISILCHEIQQRRPDFSVFSGDDILLLPTIVVGGQGLISVASNVIPQEMKALVQACLEREHTHASALHDQLVPLFTALCRESNPIPIKAAMNLLGKPSGVPRLPLTPLSQKNLEILKKVITSWTRVSL